MAEKIDDHEVYFSLKQSMKGQPREWYLKLNKNTYNPTFILWVLQEIQYGEKSALVSWVPPMNIYWAYTMGEELLYHKYIIINIARMSNYLRNR